MFHVTKWIGRIGVWNKCHKKKSGKEISEKFKLKREDKKKVNWKKIKGLFE